MDGEQVAIKAFRVDQKQDDIARVSVADTFCYAFSSVYNESAPRLILFDSAVKTRSPCLERPDTRQHLTILWGCRHSRQHKRKRAESVDITLDEPWQHGEILREEEWRGSSPQTEIGTYTT